MRSGAKARRLKLAEGEEVRVGGAKQRDGEVGEGLDKEETWGQLSGEMSDADDRTAD